MTVWVLGSALYSVYVDRIADYSTLYGSLGAGIGFLIWLWGSNMAMLYGVELNDALEHGDGGGGTTADAAA
jgi:membrane protein